MLNVPSLQSIAFIHHDIDTSQDQTGHMHCKTLIPLLQQQDLPGVHHWMKLSQLTRGMPVSASSKALQVSRRMEPKWMSIAHTN